jgi:serine protease AprX
MPRGPKKSSSTDKARSSPLPKEKDDFNLGRSTVPPALYNPKERLRCGLPENEYELGSYMIELNLLYGKGLQAAAEAFEELFRMVIGSRTTEERRLRRISKTYYSCQINVEEWKKLTDADAKDNRGREKAPTERCIYKIWPDFPVAPLIDQSVATVKADAAYRSYSATGDGICWAVIDSGIDMKHIHFGDPNRNRQYSTLLDPGVKDLHRDFTQDDAQPKQNYSALTDGFGHGTHVAGIIAGGLNPDLKPGQDFAVFENVFESDSGGKKTMVPKQRTVKPEAIHGVAPQCKLVSLRVLDSLGRGNTSNIIRALSYIREEVNGDPKFLRIHGVNISLGYEFDAEMFACGQSPLCIEVDRLVRTGVVVVVAAGNTGYAQIQTIQRSTKIRIASTINDPGNSRLAITVGATHRDSPHTYGVSYFSSAGPTGDGRLKPDIVAPGERITSCAVGRKAAGLSLANNASAYIDDSGTSMAAPHVSGAIAAFLSIRREFLQKPEDVKRIFLESATPLGREKYFEGEGLVDLMRAIQSV